MNDKIHLPMINLCPTMRCNLRCKLCGVLVPQYEYRPHMTLLEFSQTLSAVFELVDSVGKLQITGGEPLLHAELPDMLEECFKYSEQFNKLWLFTNCAVMPKSYIFDVLKTHCDKVVVHCSDYGVRRDIADELVRTLVENGVEYKHLKYYGDNQYFDGWVDNGDFVIHNRSNAELAEVFSKCSHVSRGGSWYVRGGQMHWCGRSIRGTELGKIHLRENDYLAIFDNNTTIEQKRQKLQSLMQLNFLLACDYCNGFYGTDDKSKRYPSGEQLQ